MTKGATGLPRIGAVLMAAGAGRRMRHRPKCLLLRDGEPLLVHSLRMLAAAGLSQVVVVLGHHAEPIAAVLEQCRSAADVSTAVQWTVNPNPDAGTASSLHCGLAALPAGLDGILVTLADQPLITADDIRTVLAAWHTRPPGTQLLIPRFQGNPRHPLLFDTALRQTLMAESMGVREWRKTRPETVSWLDVNHPRHTLDVDTEADLAQLAAEHGVQLHHG